TLIAEEGALETLVDSTLSRFDELVEHGQKRACPPRELEFREHACALPDAAPVVRRAEQRDLRDTAARAHLVFEIALKGVHQEDFARGAFNGARGREVRHDQVAQLPNVRGDPVREQRERFWPRVGLSQNEVGPLDRDLGLALVSYEPRAQL